MKNNLGNKQTMAENIWYHMDKNNKSRSELCEALNVPYTTLTDWLKGKTYPRIDKIELMANYFGITKADLVEERNDDNVFSIPGIFPIETKKIPLLGEVICGEPRFAEEDFECYVECGVDIHADFALRAVGDSMVNARIHDGDIVFVQQQPTVNNGEIAVVLIGEETTLKRFRRIGNTVILSPENPAYDDIIIELDEMTEVRILGKAVAFQSDVR